MNDAIYTAVFVDSDDMPATVHSNEFRSHATIQFRPTDEQFDSTPIGASVRMTITGFITTDSAQVITVQIHHDSIVVGSGVPHITISTAEGVAPVESISTIKEGVVTAACATYDVWGTVGYMSKAGKVHTTR